MAFEDDKSDPADPGSISTARAATQPRTRRRVSRVGRSITITERLGVQRFIDLFGSVEEVPSDVRRPRTRGECAPGGALHQRPCPWAGCRHHLLIDVDPYTGTLKLNHATFDVSELAATCSLDRADVGEHTLEQVGEMMNVTRERTRQIEVKALVQYRHLLLESDSEGGT